MLSESQLITEIETGHHGPSDAMHSPSSHDRVSLEEYLSHLSRRHKTMAILLSHSLRVSSIEKVAFSSSSDHYDQPTLLTTSNKLMVVSCGESFNGSTLVKTGKTTRSTFYTMEMDDTVVPIKINFATVEYHGFQDQNSVSISFRMNTSSQRGKRLHEMIRDDDWIMISRRSSKITYKSKLKPKSLKFTASDSQDTNQ
ncbi:hypothetical protein Tco_0128421 [Tanacetum coccineum]